MKVSELTGPALDWAVARCEGGTDFFFDGITWGFTLNGQSKVLASGWARSMRFTPSADWSTGGPIIERERIGISPVGIRGNWAAGTSMYRLNEQFDTGPTPLIAAMRCYVASKLGEEIEIPKELK